jgi:hypothetical protein
MQLISYERLSIPSLAGRSFIATKVVHARLLWAVSVGQYAPVCLDTCCTPKADIVQVCGMRRLQPRVAWHSRVASLDNTVAIASSYSTEL